MVVKVVLAQRMTAAFIIPLGPNASERVSFYMYIHCHLGAALQPCFCFAGGFVHVLRPRAAHVHVDRALQMASRAIAMAGPG